MPAPSRDNRVNPGRRHHIMYLTYHYTMMYCHSMKMKSNLSITLLERVSVMLRVLAHPHRLKIVEILEAQGHASVTKIHTELRLPQAATSQHLNHMKKVGLLASERNGKEVRYRIADDRAITILGCIRKKHGVTS